MSFGSFIKGIAAQVNPFDRGKTYGSYNPPQRKKRPEDQPGYQAPAFQQPTNPSQPNLPQAQRPENLFEGLNKNLQIGGPKPGAIPVFNNAAPKPQPAPPKPRTAEDDVNDGLNAGKSWEQISHETNVPIDAVRQYSQATRPSYGTVMAKPKQGFFNKVRDVFDANTQADQYRRQQGNNATPLQPGQQEKSLVLRNPGNIVSKTPIVGTVTKMLNTAGTQIAGLPSTIGGFFASKEGAAAAEEYSKAVKSGDKAKIAQAKQRVADATNRETAYNAQQEAAHSMFEKNKGGLFNAGTLYDEAASKRGDIKTGVKDIALPTAVTALDLYTLGQGSAISEGLKEGIPRVGFTGAVRNVSPNLVRATLGNYASGDLNARSQSASNEAAIKSGLINSVLGLIPDIGLPALAHGFKSNLLPAILRGRNIPAGEATQEINDAAVSAGSEAANQALKPRVIPVRQNIPIDEITSGALDVPVRTIEKQPGNIIREVAGDASKTTPASVIRENVDKARRAEAEAINNVPVDRTIEGVTPRAAEQPFNLTPEAVATGQEKVVQDYADMLRGLGEGNGVDVNRITNTRTSNNYRPGMGAGRVTKAQWLDEARRQLESGQAESGVQKAFNDAANPEVQALLAKGEQVPAPEGSPIAVKQVTGIPVTDQTVVPQGLPETPGTVRTTAATAPANQEAAIAAQTPAPILPKETQAILDNPKQFNKRQVAAARNQRKLAMQMAKTQEQTAEALNRIETASPAAASGEGFTPTGEFGKSANGGAYQKASRAAEMQQAVQETSQMSPGDVIQTARKNQLETGGFNRRDVRNVAALFESKRLPRGSVEWNEARQILKEDGTVWGQTGALRNYTMRRTATPEELISRYESKIYRLADDPTKIDSKLFDQVDAAETAYTDARDKALATYNEFTRTPTSANAKLYHAAQDAADAADKAAKQTEYGVAKKVLKGNKDIQQTRELDKMANSADLYQMDAIDASMLSGTGTFLRNFVNATTGNLEEGVFGKPAAWLSRKITGESVGGGAVGRGSIESFGKGADNVVSAAKARAVNAGKNPLEHLKNWATTGNELGDTMMDAQAFKNVRDHYTNLLKGQGYTGRELIDRASVMARQDPDNVLREYQGAARVAAGLGSGITRNNKVETLIKNVVSDAVSAGRPNGLSEATGKLVARMTVGFPTAIGRSTVEGIKRFTLGAPTFIKAIRETDPLKRSILIKEGIKQAGTGGLVLPPMFYALGAAGMISGAYPPDKETRAQWEREGKTENSIKIGGAWYQLPAFLGGWAVPGLFYASLGRNGGNFGEATADVAKAIPSLLPTDQASNIMDVINGRTDLGKFMSQQGAAAVRAVTPAGALLNQVSKAFDPTKNDTTSGTNLENFFSKVASGIPGVNNAANIPDKVDDAGNPITNPNAVETFLGAASDVQGSGEARSQQIQSQTDSTIQHLTDGGLLNDPNIKEVLDAKELAIYNKVKSGKKLKEGELETLQKGFTKGVSSTGEDTAYLEREQYDSNLAALKLKREQMNSDKTVKPSDLAKVDTAIKRGQVYKDGNIPYDLISAYQKTSLNEWRTMGDPPGDKNYDPDVYDPEMYQKLWDIDQKMTKAGVSYKTGSLDKNKYSPPKDSTGSGSGSRQLDTSFGQLKEGLFAPRVQQYDTIDTKSGAIPHISVVRPNIVHKISSSGQNKTMAAIDNIQKLAQKVYYSVNGAQNDDTGDDLTTFQNDFILGFNLWKDEYETEAYWNPVRVNDYVLGTIANTTNFSFQLSDTYRTPVIDPDKYLKFIIDGTIVAKFKMVDPNQRQVDDELDRPDRAIFVGRKIVLSRVPKDTEVGAQMVLDVVEFIPDLTRTDDSALDLIFNSQVAVLGVAKNITLADVTKVSLSPSFTQKYSNELNKAIATNNQTTDVDMMRSDNYGTIGGIW